MEEEIKNLASTQTPAAAEEAVSAEATTAQTTVAAAEAEATTAQTPADAAEAAPPVKKKKKPAIITVDNVSVKFRLQEQRVDNLKEFVIKKLKGQMKYKEFYALKDVSFKVRRGDRVGILGLNGAGKSTLLKCVAGVLKVTDGKITVKGNIVPLLELGAGFDPNYTGGENIFLYGTMLGYSRAFLKEKYDEIVEFSELKDFINVPLKNYSSGMKSRLGFAIATIVDPEILILDEVLSVGDAKFRKKSEKKVRKMVKKGATVLFVSHSTDQVLSMCNKALILDHGRVVDFGKVDRVCEVYRTQLLGEN